MRLLESLGWCNPHLQRSYWPRCSSTPNWKPTPVRPSNQDAKWACEVHRRSISYQNSTIRNTHHPETHRIYSLPQNKDLILQDWKPYFETICASKINIFIQIRPRFLRTKEKIMIMFNILHIVIISTCSTMRPGLEKTTLYRLRASALWVNANCCSEPFLIVSNSCIGV